MTTFLTRALAPLAATLIAAAAAAEAPRLRAQDTIGDLLAKPALSGFAQRTLSWAGRQYDPAMKLGEIAALLPFTAT